MSRDTRIQKTQQRISPLEPKPLILAGLLMHPKRHVCIVFCVAYMFALYSRDGRRAAGGTEGRIGEFACGTPK